MRSGIGRMAPDMPLDWVADGEEDEVPLLAFLDANVNKEEFHRETMIACQKTKGRREVLNLKSSINYGDNYVTSRHQKGKAYKM